ncbi:cyclic pyranopterin monophosphate synthase MoaC, partial [Klebsiella pneumoniae]|uniref:cyclic pyranopterin monophosphate synthase MoaC n=1 Tax=Klebsiella pneumoniae TaxID=573 RepID=UPI003A89CD7D
MVDVGAKPPTQREAVARGRVFMHQATLDLLHGHEAKKGDVLTVAKIAAIQGAKRASDLIPLAHAVALDGIEIQFLPAPDTLVTAAVPSELVAWHEGLVTPQHVDHVLLDVSDP